MNKNNTNTCNNCGKNGHMFHQCKLPITSYGMIVFRYNNNSKVEFLMIRRKDSFGFIDFIRGKYSPYNINQLISIVDQMSLEEKERIKTLTFENLWNEMWGKSSSFNNQYRNEEIMSKKKFDIVKEGIKIDDVIITLDDIINQSKTAYNETEWELPKGRRNNKEKDIDCALREFEEETGISVNLINVVENLLPFEETFIGTNHKSYKHKYFLAYNKSTDLLDLTNYQKTEVGSLEWKTLEMCLESIRPYNLEKIDLMKNINKVLEEYRLY